MNRHRFSARGLLVLAALLIQIATFPQPALAADLRPPQARARQVTQLLVPWVSRLSIDYLRSQAYPGSPITVEETLSPGVGYRRYIASFRSEDLKQYALLLVPGGKRPANGWPVIVFNHGYIEPSEYKPTVAYEATMDALARAGYIVFRPDLRGHGESEGEPENAFLSPAYTIDVLNAVAAIKQYGDADPRRIGMWGHSMGGWMTLRAMVVSPDIQAGVIWGGAVGTYEDMLTKWLPALGKDGLMRPDASSGAAGDYSVTLKQVDPLWRSLSAHYFMEDLSGPLQLHHGVADRNVPLVFSESVLVAGKAAGMPVELTAYEGDDHGISAHFRQALASTVAFYDKWLRNPANLSEVKTPTVIAPGKVNLRSGPSTTTPVVGQMQPGQRLPVVAANAQRTWWLVETPTGRAWVAAAVTTAAHVADVPLATS